MGSATWQASAVVDAAPDDVWTWLTDFTSDDHNSDAYRRGAGIDPAKKQKPSKRTVLSREGNVLRIEDQWGASKYASTVTLDPAARSVRIEGGFGYDATWTAAPEGAGTRLSVQGRMGRGVLGSLVKLFEGRIARSMEQDFRGHVEDLRETLKTEKKA